MHAQEHSLPTHPAPLLASVETSAREPSSPMRTEPSASIQQRQSLPQSNNNSAHFHFPSHLLAESSSVVASSASHSRALTAPLMNMFSGMMNMSEASKSPQPHSTRSSPSKGSTVFHSGYDTITRERLSALVDELEAHDDGVDHKRAGHEEICPPSKSILVGDEDVFHQHPSMAHSEPMAGASGTFKPVNMSLRSELEHKSEAVADDDEEDKDQQDIGRVKRIKISESNWTSPAETTQTQEAAALGTTENSGTAAALAAVFDVLGENQGLEAKSGFEELTMNSEASTGLRHTKHSLDKSKLHHSMDQPGFVPLFTQDALHFLDTNPIKVEEPTSRVQEDAPSISHAHESSKDAVSKPYTNHTSDGISLTGIPSALEQQLNDSTSFIGAPSSSLVEPASLEKAVNDSYEPRGSLSIQIGANKNHRGLDMESRNHVESSIPVVPGELSVSHASVNPIAAAAAESPEKETFTSTKNRSMWVELPTEVEVDIRKLVKNFPSLNAVNDANAEEQEKNEPKKLIGDATMARFEVSSYSEIFGGEEEREEEEEEDFTYESMHLSKLMARAGTARASKLTDDEKSRLFSLERAFQALQDAIGTGTYMARQASYFLESISLSEIQQRITSPAKVSQSPIKAEPMSPIAPKRRLLQLLTEVDVGSSTSLNLSAKNLETVYNLSEVYPNATVLDLSFNQIHLVAGLSESLVSLTITDNQLTDATTFFHLPNLQFLDISRNDITTLKGLGPLIHLRDLVADGCKFTSLDGLQLLTGIMRVSLKHNRVASLSTKTGPLLSMSLASLELENNCIEKIEGLEQMLGLKTLNLGKTITGEYLSLYKGKTESRKLSFARLLLPCNHLCYTAIFFKILMFVTSLPCKL